MMFNKTKLENKTWKYLYLSVLRGWDEELKIVLNRANKTRVAIQDTIASKEIKQDLRPKIFIEVLPDMFFKLFYNQDLPLLRKHKSYVGDYSTFVGEEQRHVIVLALPEKFNQAYQQFLKGKYSKMYSLEEIAELYVSDNFREYKNILFKTDSAKEKFIELLNKEFQTDFFPDPGEAEFDLPLIAEEEIFNNTLTRKFI